MASLNHYTYVWMFSGVSSLKKLKIYLNDYYGFYIMNIQSRKRNYC